MMEYGNELNEMMEYGNAAGFNDAKTS